MGIVDLIKRDVRFENETKKGVVTIRIFYIIILLADILNLIFAGFPVLEAFPVRITLIFLSIPILFICTYFFRTAVSLFLFLLFAFCYSLSMIPCFGWSAGMQNYFIIILMISFFAVHGSLFFKIILTVIVLAARIFTIFIYSGTPSEVKISEVSGKLIQSVNISAVFLSVVIISYIYGHRETLEESKLMKYNTRLVREAHTDQLTGLYNRRYVSEYLENLERSSNLPAVSVAMGDIDFFKKVNDRYGHDAGDAVLKAIADALRTCGTEGSLVARWGGEEFLIVFQGLNGDEARVILEDLRSHIEKMTIPVGDAGIRVTMTFGLTEYDFSGNTEPTIKEADEKLYLGKTSGRNRVVY